MDRCEICERAVTTTKHHLTPKDRKDSEIARICGPCHRQIHAVFTHHDLKYRYNAVEDLKESAEMRKFARWVRKTGKTNVKVRDSRDVRRWRR